MALEARIAQLLAADENKKCADCGTRSPRWASYSLGIFMCLQCAGFHRALGVHISRVKSCDLDRWTEDQVRAMEAVGNARGREEYGPSYAEVNNTTYLPDAQSLETFIKSKYMRRLYAKGGFGATFNVPAAAAGVGAAAVRRPLPVSNEDMWGEYREPEIDTTSKIRIDWPRKPTATAAAAAAAAATAVKPQKEPSLIDLFEPAAVPVVRQQPTASAAPAATFVPFFADFAAAPTAAAAAPPDSDPFGLIAEAAAPKQPQQLQPFGGFPLQQQQTQQIRPQLSFDDDFGDFVAAAAAVKQPSCGVVQPVQQLQKLQPTAASLFGDDSENVPPPLPPKDYDPFESLTPSTRRDNPSVSASGSVAAASAPVGASPIDALAGLFGASTALAPTASHASSASASASVAPSIAAAPRMSTADIMALYGTRSGGGGAQPPAMPTFVPNFGGPGTSWA